MASTQDCATLSLYVYDVLDRRVNRPSMPTGWAELELKTDNFYGFSYGIFQGPGNEIVLAYTGTNEGIDWLSNIGSGLGIGSPQVSAAALVFARAREQYGANITLTGHSLGGGLASIMSVWFNRPAVVFDHASFELAARNPLFVQASKAALALGGFELGEFLGYDGILNFATREINVQGHHIEGEALQYLRAVAPTIGGSQSLRVGEGLGSVDLHSMALYVAARMSPSFVQATLKSAHFLPVIFDVDFYNAKTKESSEKNFLIDLIRSEQANAGNGKLSHFAADLHRLGQSLAGLNEAAQKALVAQAVEWYYWQGTNYAGQEVFVRSGSGQVAPVLRYATAQGADLPNAQNRAESYVKAWLEPLVKASGGIYTDKLAQAQQWSVVTAPLVNTNSTASDANKTQMFVGNTGADRFVGGAKADVMLGGDGKDTLLGGEGNDTLLGGTGDDVLEGGADRDLLIGGLGNDILRGGLGSDTLMGGVGLDVYEFTAAVPVQDSDAVVYMRDFPVNRGVSQTDVIEDSDGLGEIRLNGRVLNGGSLFAPKNWRSTDQFETYSLVGSGADAMLVITYGFDKHRIIVRNWRRSVGAAASQQGGGDLGIRLVDMMDPNHQPQNPLVAHSEWVIGDSGANYIVAAPTYWLNQQPPQMNYMVDGGASPDTIVAGAGDDLISGGAGSDFIDSGDGNDYIIGALATAFANATPYGMYDRFGAWSPAPGGYALIRGRTWGVYSNGEYIIFPIASHEVAKFVNNFYDGEDAPDVIYSGDGNDTINAGNGNDILDGGAGFDEVWGWGGDDVISGGAGDDFLVGDSADGGLRAALARQGNDYMDGGDGNDSIWGSGGADTAYGGAGDDLVFGDDVAADNLNYHGRDELHGGSGADSIFGQGGNDVVFGDSGDDRLYGDFGFMDGGLPFPTIYGDDFLDGGEGDDVIWGGWGHDTLIGGAGHDILEGDNGSYEEDSPYSGNDLLDGGDGNDHLWGGGGNDTLMGGVGRDQLAGGAGDDWLRGGEDNDRLYGNDGDDRLYGEAGDDELQGNLGDDHLDGGDGHDTLFGGEGNDQLVGGDGSDWLRSGDGHDALEGGLGNDRLWGESGNDTLYGGDGADTLDGGAGDDQLSGGDGYDSLEGGDGHDLLDGGGINDVLLGGAGQDTLIGGGGDDRMFGDEGNDVLLGDDGDDYLEGGSGNDTLDGGAGDDYLTGGYGANVYRFGLGSGVDRIDNWTPDHRVGTDRDRIAMGVRHDEVQWAREGRDLIVRIRGTADELRVISYFWGGAHAVDFIDFSNGVSLSYDQVRRLNFVAPATDGDDELSGFETDDVVVGGKGNDTLNGLEGLDTLDGGEGNDRLYGHDGKDLLLGGAGQDWLDGGSDGDTLKGGAGDDVYIVDHQGDVVVELAGEGVDVVWSSVSYTLGDHVDHLTLTGYDAVDGYGNGLNNHLVGNSNGNVLVAAAGDDTLDGGGGNNTLAGGVGNDRYIVRSSHDLVHENAGEGVDTVEVYTYSYLLPLYVENAEARLGSVLIEGNNLDNVLIGGYAHDTLKGGAGVDTLIGGNGSDLYYVDDPRDVVIEQDAEGDDSVVASSDFSLELNPFVENAYLTGQGDYVLIGNLARNYMGGNSGDNVLDGRGGADTMEGGHGDDVYFMDHFVSVWDYNYVIEKPNEGNDTVIRSVETNLILWSNVENLTLTGAAKTGFGNELNNLLKANDVGSYLGGRVGNDTLLGGLGNDDLRGDEGDDVIQGGHGDDQAVGGAGNDVVIYNRGDGVDNLWLEDVTTAIDTLRLGSGILEQDVVLQNMSGSLSISLRNDAGRIWALNHFAAATTSNGVTKDHKLDRIEFNSGAVWNAAKIQEMVSNANNSNRAPAVNTAVLTPLLSARAGRSFSYTFAANTLVDPDPGQVIAYRVVMPDGSAVPSWLQFNATTRTLSGTPGAEAVGSLRFVLQGTDPQGRFTGKYIDLAVAGANRVPVVAVALPDRQVGPGKAWSFTVAEGSFVDPDAADTLTYSAGGEHGAALPSWLTFNPTTRTFSGTAPTASATHRVEVTARDADGASVTDVFDLRVSTVGLSLTGTAEGDHLIGQAFDDKLYGLEGHDVLSGGEGNDTLDGGAGGDRMMGGKGNDTYVVDNVWDVVTEVAGEGTDTVRASVSYTLGVQVENLTLTGTAAINATGNTLGNVLTGNGAANVLDGGVGADVMRGGAGNDTYVVDHSRDVVTEGVNAGTDTVRSSVSYTLGANVENLTLTGTATINGTGNELSNVLTGNNAVNVLSGGAGNDTLSGGGGADTLDGGSGNDRLLGGTGSDTYRFGRGGGADVISENSTVATHRDRAVFGADVAADQLWFRKVSNHLEVSIIGSQDKITITDWYRGSAYRVEEFVTVDGQVLLESQVQNLVQAMAAFSPPVAGQTTLPTSYQTTLAPVIAANWT